MFGPTDITIIFGKRGCGKSVLQRRISSCYPRLVVIDRLKEHRDGDFVTKDFNQFANFLSRAMTENWATFKLVLQFDVEQKTEDQENVFSHAVRLVYKWGEITRKNIALSVEEVQHFAGPTSIDHWLFESVMTGRHSNMALLASSQRPASVHKGLVSQASHVFIGQLFERRDIEYLRATTSDQAAYAAAKLEPYTFIHFIPGQGYKLVKNQ